MKQFFKDLFWYGFGTLTLIFISITMYCYLYNSDAIDNIYFALLMLFCVVIIWAQIIIMMVKSIKKKEYKDTILIYLLNMFYIPLYYGIKKNGNKKIGIIMIIINIIIYLFSMFIILKYAFDIFNMDDNYSYQETYVIEDYNIKITPNYKWLKDEDNTIYDLKLSLDDSYAGIWCYKYDEIGDNLTYEDVLDYNIEKLNESYDLELIEDKNPEIVDNKTRDSILYKINYNGVDIYFYFNIIDDKVNKKMVYVIFSTELDDYDSLLKIKQDDLIDSIVIE